MKQAWRELWRSEFIRFLFWAVLLLLPIIPLRIWVFNG